MIVVTIYKHLLNYPYMLKDANHAYLICHTQERCFVPIAVASVQIDQTFCCSPTRCMVPKTSSSAK